MMVTGPSLHRVTAILAKRPCCTVLGRAWPRRRIAPKRAVRALAHGAMEVGLVALERREQRELRHEKQPAVTDRAPTASLHRLAEPD